MEELNNQTPSTNDNDTVTVVTENYEIEKDDGPKKTGNKTIKVVKTVWNSITWVIVALVVVFAILLVGVRLFGYQVFTVISGSMEPTYHVGSLVYVDVIEKEADKKLLKVGDPVTYVVDDNGTVVTHRIIGIAEVPPEAQDKTAVRYITKGDANDSADLTTLHHKNVIGKPVFSIPYLGYVADFVQNPPGTYIAVSVGILVILLAFLPDIIFPEEDKDKKKKKTKTAEEPQA